ncbi:21016_t:CDS:2, partial [Gigaspora margarita]
PDKMNNATWAHVNRCYKNGIVDDIKKMFKNETTQIKNEVLSKKSKNMRVAFIESKEIRSETKKQAFNQYQRFDESYTNKINNIECCNQY